MIEVYLFHAMFAVQIVVGSVLLPRKLIQLGRESIARDSTALPANAEQQMQRAIVHYRLANAGVILVGLLLMGWLFSYMQGPEWSDGPVEAFMAPYVLLQYLPFFVLALRVAHIGKALKSSLLVGKRRALLQRRSLFDFVSPVPVMLALLCYPLYVAMVLYIARDPFPGFAGPAVNIGLMTLLYCGMGFVIYHLIYGRNRNPQQGHDERLRTIAMGVKAAVYSCMAAVLMTMANFTLVLLDNQRLEPVAATVGFVIMALWLYHNLHAATKSNRNGAIHAGAAG